VRQFRVGDAEILVLPDEPAVAREGSRRTVEGLRRAIAERGEAHLALSGGSSAIALYRELRQAEWRSAIPWAQVHFWWGDERFVPLDHPESNAGLAYRLLFAIAAHAGESGEGGEAVDVLDCDLAGLPIDAGKVHPVEVEDTIGVAGTVELAAQQYAADLERWLPRGAGGLPAFDVFLTGVGPDGHTLSMFPGSPALAPDAPLVIGVPAPTHVEPRLARVTLSARMMAAAGELLVMTAGEAKADVLAQVLGEERDAARWPAQAALLPNAVWLLDEAVAARTKTPPG
jgi:6-phosphogluconolactonase